MRNTNKKGFTVVELVIVIAVIAILAAVLIPTFAGIIRQANLSADQQAVRQMNVALAAGSVEGKPAGSEDVIEILAEAGYNSRTALIPVTSGYQFCWYSTANSIVLVDTEGNIVYPKNLVDSEPADGTLHNLANGYAIESTVANLDELKSVFANLKADDNIEIVFSEAIVITEELAIPAGAEVTLNLNGKTVSSTIGGDYYPIFNEGELTIVGGTIENTASCAVRNIGTLTLENVTVKGVSSAVLSTGDVIINGGTFDGAVAVDAWGGNVVINDGTFTNTNKDGYGSWGMESAAIVNNGANVTINGGTFTASEGTYVINAMLNGDIGTLEINGGTFVGGNGITFNGEIEIHNGTFDCEIEAIGGFHVDGGTFSQQITIHSWHSTDSSVDDRDIIISGGNFTYGDGQFIGDGSIDGTISGGTFNTTEAELFENDDFVYVDFTGGSFKN